MPDQEVNLNLPPITVNAGTVLERTELGSSQHPNGHNSFCTEYDDAHPSTINIVNSSDVIIGSVTQFHGPVTIVQHLQSKAAIEDKNGEGIDGAAHMVTTDYASSGVDSKSPSSSSCQVCLPKRLLLCFTALAILIVVIIVSVILTLDVPLEPIIDIPDDSQENVTGFAKYNISGHHYYTVESWGGRAPLYEVNVSQPIHFVIISHTAGVQCHDFYECSVQMRNIQSEHVSNGSPNVGYNFVIGGDGDIYEGRGWYVRNFHRDHSIGICFVGNYVYDELTINMVDALDKLLENGVEIEALPADYYIIAHNHTYATLSPGQNVYKVLKGLPNFYKDVLPSPRD